MPITFLFVKVQGNILLSNYLFPNYSFNLNVTINILNIIILLCYLLVRLTVEANGRLHKSIK